MGLEFQRAHYVPKTVLTYFAILNNLRPFTVLQVPHFKGGQNLLIKICCINPTCYTSNTAHVVHGLVTSHCSFSARLAPRSPHPTAAAVVSQLPRWELTAVWRASPLREHFRRSTLTDSNQTLKTLYDFIEAGLKSNQRRHWPFESILNITEASLDNLLPDVVWLNFSSKAPR